MPSVQYENTYKNREKSTNITLLSSPEAGKKENRAGSGSMEKSVHDFRSSLNIIIGYSELMLDDVLGRMTEEQRDGVKDILASSRHMLDLIDYISYPQTPTRI